MDRAADLGPVAAAGVVAIAAAFGGAFFPAERLVVGALFALLLGVEAIRGIRTGLRVEEKVVLGLVIWGAVSAAIVASSPLAAKETTVGWLIAWCIWVFARRSGDTAAALARVVLVAAALIVALGVLLEAIGLGEIRVGGLMENPNFAAALLITALPLGGRVFEGHGRFLPAVISIALVVGVVLTGSRAGLLALLMAGFVVLPRGGTRLVGLAGGIFVATLVLGWRFVSHPDIFAWFRPAIWLGVLRLWMAHPLCGVGPGGLTDAAGPVRLLHADHIGQHQFLITLAESSPLGLLVQTGVVGVVIAVVAAYLWIRSDRRANLFHNPRFRAALAGMAAMAVFHDFLTIEIVLWWWALVIGLLESERTAADHVVGSCSLPARLTGGLALAMVVLWGVVQPAWARWLWRSMPPSVERLTRATAAEPWYDAPYEWRVRALLNEREWNWRMTAEALALSNQAVRARPGASRNWMTLGRVHFRVVTELGPWPDSVTGARDAFVKAAALEPHQPWPWLELARLERGIGNLDRAAALARRAVAEEPNAVRARLYLARVELDRGNVHLAREALEEARASARMSSRPALKDYEKELLAAPSWQFQQLEEALR